jgi:Uma2 family endonuclease
MIRHLDTAHLTRPAPTAEGRFRFSRHDFARMVEAGILTKADRVELIDGELVAMTPIGPLHGGITAQLNAFFSQHTAGRALCWVQGPVAVRPETELYPDLALLTPEPGFYRQRHPQPADVLLIIEIADTSAAKDCGVKVREYARAGIREYWVVDLEKRCVAVFREPAGDGFAVSNEYAAGEFISPVAFPDCRLDLQWLLGSAQ